MILSDMMTHYNSIKNKYPDCIVFYRLGDFYEMFNEDAVVASEVLDLTLTGRHCGTDEDGNKQRAPMCGVPFHAADDYIARLVRAGHKVAICEQLSEPSKGKQLVLRDVVRVVTAGTLTEPTQIDEKTNNFICSIYLSPEKKGGVFGAVSWADITTGEFFVREAFSEGELYDVLVRVSPSEIIADEQSEDRLKSAPVFSRKVLPPPSRYDGAAFVPSAARKALTEQFKVRDLTSFGIADKTAVICAAGGLVEYLRETQKHALENVSSVRLELSQDSMQLDAVCLRNLEILKSSRDGKEYGTLLWVLDQTKTAMGARALKSALLMPLQSAQKINERLDGVEQLYKNMVVLSAVREELAAVKDIERISGNVSNGNVTPKDMEALWHSLAVIPSIKMNLSGLDCAAISAIKNALTDESELVNLLKSALKENCPVSYKEGGFIAPGFDENLDRLNEMRESGKEYLEQMEENERERTGIKSLKIRYNKVFGYYIEVSNTFKDRVPYDYVRKQTLVGAERYITEELKHFEDDILNAAERALRIELQIFDKLKSLLQSNIERLKSIAKGFSALDVLCSLAYVSKKNDYVRPEICDSSKPLDIVGGRHPVVEQTGRERFIANDAFLDCSENNMLVITGPNMAGKSTYMRQVALITIMAHVGCFVPARSASIPITDRVFTRVGASDNLIYDQSTFMVEMSEVALILRSATEKSLLVLDEVGRGTSTYDGLSIAWSVIEYICKHLHAKTLFATHYHELSELEGVLDGVKNYKITVKETTDGILFLRKIMRGSANRSFGIEVAALAGVPAEVTSRAKAILKRLEKNDLAQRQKKGEDIIGELASADSSKESDLSSDSSDCSVSGGDSVLNYSEVEAILRDVCVDDLTPRMAFDLICELKEKLN